MTPVETTSVLAIDPGMNTGVSLVDGSGEVVRSFTCQSPFLPLREFLKGLDSNIEVVAERGTEFGGHGKALIQQVEEIVRTLCPQVSWVTPSQWKSSPQARRGVPSGLTKHEGDATRMGRWFQSTRRSHEESSTQGDTSRAHEGAA